ncbi:sensor histidine kinase [Porphyrobacter sp. GA68]|uniref:sensor histidine kinase n=1 Tax=Porphyrobacter sp. GA68 TaxID=2883480 RepID=UPI001D17F791|nr:HWE histidine kinase domain-containing protein [Porphyrobacter sp. GA68]
MKDENGEALPEAPQKSEAEFRELADYAPVMIWRSNTDKLCDWFNQPWLEFTGRSMDQELGYGWAEGVHPDDFDRCVAHYNEAFDARRPFTMEYRLRRHDGEYRWLLDNGAPFERDGEFAGYFGSCIDIEAQKQLESRQRLMIDELNHRVKNTLAIVQSVAAQTFKNHGDRNESLLAFEGRLRALAAAHGLLTENSWSAVSLKQLLADAFAVCQDAQGRIVADGPELLLSPQTAVSLAMGMHELCTNALKYGALSTAEGRVTVDWTLRPEAPTGGSILHLVWQERDGPSVELPKTRGFGTVMLQRALVAELDGTVELQFLEDGLRCTISAPFPQGEGERA